MIDRSFNSNVPVRTVPRAIVQVANDVAAFLDVPVNDLFVADHTHEEVSEGSWTIALEGQYDWPYLFVHNTIQRPAPPEGYGLEAYTGWALLIYRDKER